MGQRDGEGRPMRLRSGRLRIVVVSATDVRDQRLFKQVHVLESLGHDVLLVAPDTRTRRFAVSSGFARFPDEVFGMRRPAGAPPATARSHPSPERGPQPRRSRLRSLVGRLLAPMLRWRADRRRRRWFRTALPLVEQAAPDLVMLHRLGLAQHLLGRLRHVAPTVVDLHELPKELHAGDATIARDVRTRRLRTRRRRAIRALARADLVTGEELIVAHVRQHFSAVVHELPESMVPSTEGHGDTDRPQETRSVRARLGLGPSSRIIVYLGFAQAGRGLESLVRTIEPLPSDHHLALIIGSTGAGLQETVGRSAAAGRIHLLDFVPQDQLVDLLRGCDLGVYLPDPPDRPHAHLCMPTKLFEFHAAEVPMLVAGDRGLREFATRYGGAVVLDRPVTPESTADAIEGLLDEPQTVPPRRPTPRLDEVMTSILRSLGWSEGDVLASTDRLR